jgi:tRNA A-37 threonylcarbamoyl transferase component Bud32
VTRDLEATATNAVARFKRDGWTLWFAGGEREMWPRLRLRLVEGALKLAAGAGDEPLRRSRHASTYYLRLEQGRGRALDAFVKLLDAQSGGLNALRCLVTRSRAERLHGIARALEAAGFAIAPLLMVGEQRQSGRTIVVTAMVSGVSLAHFLLDAGLNPQRKWRTLRALGAEVARLHRAGFLHGDLTPYNVFVANGLPERFVFIDHERTVRPRLVWQRRRLRNLVQLCRFDLDGMSRTDRSRIVDAYAREMGRERRRLVRRLSEMLRARRLRDAVRAGEIEPAFASSQQRPGVNRS